MTHERRWSYSVRDARGRTHRGIVTFGAMPADLRAPEAPKRFQIVLLATPAIVRDAPERTAICVPGVPRLHAVGQVAELALPRRIAELTLPPQRMAEYATGRIVMAAEGLIAPTDVFAPHTDRPRLDRLALLLVEAASAEAAAPYTAVIRRELKLPPGTDAVAALDSRLSTTDPGAKPPTRAPAIARLRRTLRSLLDDRIPAEPLDTLADDLRFLMLFDNGEDRLPADGMKALLRDVLEPDAEHTPPLRHSAPITPLHRPRGDA